MKRASTGGRRGGQRECKREERPDDPKKRQQEPQKDSPKDINQRKKHNERRTHISNARKKVKKHERSNDHIFLTKNEGIND